MCGSRAKRKQHLAPHRKLLFLHFTFSPAAAKSSQNQCAIMEPALRSVELSVVLRDNAVLADLAVALQRLVGRRGLADSVASEMALTARDLRRMPTGDGPACKGVIVGEAHEEAMRTASANATKRFFVGCHRLGSTARPGAIMQGEVAAARPGVSATILYTQPSGPIKNRHARALRDEAAANGVNLVKIRKTPLHGKIVVWGDDDVIVTSLNRASASADPEAVAGSTGQSGMRVSIRGAARGVKRHSIPRAKRYSVTTAIRSTSIGYGGFAALV
jgi:hypothetical protein